MADTDIKNCRVSTTSRAIQDPHLCLASTVQCPSMKFNSTTFIWSENVTLTLEPNQGCNLEMSRFDNGSYGTVQFSYLSGKPLIFDSENEFIEQGYSYGLPLADNGWDNRTFFIANNGSSNIELLITYNGAIKMIVSGFLVLALALL
mmetsp:Transcript_17782/g.12730  ORF Transcript_17782/g.12730 Transcript_17782/m.12730 type:complete len:147 (-) Transcript_17782:44-484(-)